jgi:DNA (cytosine-5)-methyltransferase 1
MYHNNTMLNTLKITQLLNQQDDEFDLYLAKAGLSYNDLHYETNPPNQLITTEYKTLDFYKKPFHGTPVVSFFSGCGGLDLGFEVAGFKHIALIEHNQIFCETLRHNRNWTVIGPPNESGDVSNRIEIQNTLKNMNISKFFDGVFLGGPPCQPFSIASNQRFSKNGQNFKRIGFQHETNGNLLFDFVWQIQQFLPKAFLIENVTGLIELDSGKQIDKVYKILQDVGYTIHSPLKLNAAHYSVPQQRERIFIIGYLGTKLFKEPKKNHEIIPCYAALSNLDDSSLNHVTRKHKASSIKRYIKLHPGERDKQGRVDRLNPFFPSKTVIAGGNSGGGRSHLHPYIPRTLTVRECARLQTFPDDFEFMGSSARQFTQVGNAVPPILAAQLASAMYGSYFNSRSMRCVE